jgi:hypothetical protein
LLHDRAARPLPKRQQQKQEFLNRIIPLVLANTRIGTWRDRAAYAEYRERRSSRLWSSTLRVLEKTTSGSTRRCKRRHNEVGDVLAYVKDVLVPHGFDDIVKGDLLGVAPDFLAASLMLVCSMLIIR